MSMEMTTTDWPVAAPVGAQCSLLAEDLEIDGDVSSAGPVDITGKVIGTVRAPDVVICATGCVLGQVTARSLSVLGKINGAIDAKFVVLCGSAQVSADIAHQLITIETGAQFEGSLKRRS